MESQSCGTLRKQIFKTVESVHTLRLTDYKGISLVAPSFIIIDLDLSAFGT